MQHLLHYQRLGKSIIEIGVLLLPETFQENSQNCNTGTQAQEIYREDKIIHDLTIHQQSSLIQIPVGTKCSATTVS